MPGASEMTYIVSSGALNSTHSPHDLITHANCGEDRLRGFGLVRGRILAFSIDLLFTAYNTIALPCECVIHVNHRRISAGVF